MTNPQEQQKKKKKRFWIWLVVVGLLLTGCLGWYLWKHTKVIVTLTTKRPPVPVPMNIVPTQKRSCEETHTCLPARPVVETNVDGKERTTTPLQPSVKEGQRAISVIPPVPDAKSDQTAPSQNSDKPQPGKKSSHGSTLAAKKSASNRSAPSITSPTIAVPQPSKPVPAEQPSEPKRPEWCWNFTDIDSRVRWQITCEHDWESRARCHHECLSSRDAMQRCLAKYKRPLAVNILSIPIA